MRRSAGEHIAGFTSTNFYDGLTPIPVKNMSGEKIPPFACMRLTDAANSSLDDIIASSAINFCCEIIDEEEYLFYVSKPDAGAESRQSAQYLMFNGPDPIAAGKTGAGFRSAGPLMVRFVSAGSPEALEALKPIGPVSGQWHLAHSGSAYVAWSLDRYNELVTTADSAKTMCWAVPSPSSAGGGLVWTPLGGIPGRSGLGSVGDPFVWGSAACEKVGTDGVIGADTLVVKNMVKKSIGGDELIQYKFIGGIAFVDVEEC